MSSNPEIRKESTVLPANVGNKNNASEHNSALTVDLSPATASADAEGKTSVLTTAPIDSSKSTSQTTVNAKDATVIRNRNNQQEPSGSHSSSTELFTGHNSPNDAVIIVDNELIDGYIPARLGDYQLIKNIGAGGMGNIFLATDLYLDREVAIKILLPKYQSTDLQERFIVEAKASAKLHHENIVTIYSFGETNGLPYFVMEFIPGSNLRDIIVKTGTLSIENVLSYTIQIASALEHINENGIVHRDIKPSNVLITNDGTVKVIDLGLAKDFIHLPDDELTKTGVTLGTFDYISPEQAQDPRHVDIRADIYSLGCTMYFMLIGKPPFAEKNRVQKIVSHQVDETPNIRTLRPNVPERLADIVMKCMAKNPDLRYQTPQELSKELYIAAEEQGMRPTRFSLSKWYLPSKSRLKVWKDRLSWAVPIIILVFACMILDYIWKVDPRQSEFLPETPGLKRNVASENSRERSLSIFGSTIKKGKALEFNSVPQPAEAPVPTENETPQKDVVATEQKPPADNKSPTVSEPIIPPTDISSNDIQPVHESVTPTTPSQESGVSETPDNPNQKNIIHSVRLETD
ncbi:MAG: protein kinase [Thermoguttaceae bacterium]|nr:protein kinase [Thermoguttaceae bacterium]